MKFLSLVRETQRLSVSLRMCHAEVRVHVLFDGAALAMTDHGHRGTAEIADAAQNRVVVTEITVAVQLDEIVKQLVDIIGQHRSFGIMNDTHFFACRSVSHVSTPAISLPWDCNAVGAAFQAFPLIDYAELFYHRNRVKARIPTIENHPAVSDQSCPQ